MGQRAEQRTGFRKAFATLGQAGGWGTVVWSAVGGYAAALAGWAITHAHILADFVLKNELPLAMRRDLALLLIVGLGAGALVGLALRRWRPSGRAQPIAGQPAVSAPVDVRLSASPSARVGLYMTLALAGLYAAFMSLLSVARHNSFMTHAFDLGIHDQAIFNILHLGYMRTTLYGPYAIDYIGDHFSPILYLLAPIYALYQDARTLLVVQSVVLAAGALPLYLLAYRKTRSALWGVALVIAYLVYPALHGANFRDFHQIALVCAPLLAAFYFLETKRDVSLFVALGLVLIVKEEVALTIAAIGLYAFFGIRRRWLGVALVTVGLLYFGVVVGWVMPRLGGTPQIDSRFGGYIAPGTHGAIGVAWTLFTNPLFTVAWIVGNPAKLLFLAQIFVPVLLLPLLAPAEAWLLALPALAILLLTSAHTQFDITYHYAAHLIPSLFYLAVLGAAKLRGRGRAALTAGVLGAGLLSNLLWGGVFPRQGVVIPTPSQHAAVLARFIAEVPNSASVSTMSDIAPHLTARETVYLFPDVADAEFLLLDTHPQTNFWPHEGLKARDRAIKDMLPYVNSGDFGLLRAEDGVFLFQRGRDAAQKSAAMIALLTTRYEAESQPSDLAASVSLDPQASGGQARTATPAALHADGKAGLSYGPYTDLPPGKYRIEFRMKTDRAGRDELIARADVFTFHDGGLPRAERELPRHQFCSGGSIRGFHGGI